MVEFLRKAVLDGADQRRALVDETGVKLKQRGAGFDLGEGPLRAVDAADADQGNCTLGLAVDAGKNDCGALEQRPAGEPAGSDL